MLHRTVRVYNLTTGVEMYYMDITPRDAVKLAHASDKGLSTAVAIRGLDALRDLQVLEGVHVVSCGDWTALKEVASKYE